MGEKGQRSAAKTVFVIMLIVELIVVLLIFLTTILFSSKESAPSFMGHTFFVSDNQKMDDAVRTDSLVVAKNGRPDGSVVGGVILCKDIPGFETDIFRVVGAEATTDTFIYRVCLDSSPSDVFDIDAKNVIGECKYYMHTTGRMILFVKSKIGVLICVIIPALLLAFIELILGFMKEMKKRDLQKKRETVKREQQKNYSTKRHRDREFSVDDFKNEEAELRRIHQKNNKEVRSPDRSTVRSFRLARDERTKLMDIPPQKKNVNAAYDDEEEYENSVYEARISEASEADSVDSFNSQYKDIKVTNNVESQAEHFVEPSEREEIPEQPSVETVETAVEEPVYEKAEEQSASEPVKEEAPTSEPARKPLKPSMSLEEMMALMNDNKTKLRKDIEKHSN